MALFGGSDQELRVTIKAKDDASAQINKVNASVGSLAKGFAVGTVAVDAMRSGFRFLSGVVTDSIREFEEQSLAIGQLNAALTSTRHAAGLTSRELVDMAKSLSAATLYTDESVIAAEALLLTFTNITGDVFPRTMTAVLDLSTALGQDLSASATQLGKALNNPIEGLAALSRVGIQFTGTQQDMVEQLVKGGRTLEAQNFILEELERRFGNSAKSAYEAASSITKLQKNVSELKQEIGAGITPAVNNLFDAFQSVTTGMGRNADVGKVVFKTFAAIGEFAANTAAGIHFLAGEIVKLGSRYVQVGSIVGIVTKQGREAFDNFRESVDEGVESTVDFAIELRDRNKAVEASWGSVTDEARVFGRVGPAAYEATADEAAAATKKIKESQRAVLDATASLEDFEKTLRGDDADAAAAFVEQERKVSELRKAIAEEDDAARRSELNAELTTESGALERARSQFGNDPLVAEARRRAGLTDFERTIEDVRDRRLERVREDLPRIILNMNFNDVVAGDEGVQQIIQKTIAQLNRQTTLSSVAGQ